MVAEADVFDADVLDADVVDADVVDAGVVESVLDSKSSVNSLDTEVVAEVLDPV